MTIRLDHGNQNELVNPQYGLGQPWALAITCEGRRERLLHDKGREVSILNNDISTLAMNCLYPDLEVV